MASDINAWLEQLGLSRYAEAFAEQDIDFTLLPELSDADLRELGLSLGHRRKFLRAISKLTADDTSPTGVKSVLGRPEAERRQLTVMFCDLVGSTRLSARLEAEDMRDIISAYQNAVAGNVARFEGHVAKFMGDGVLAYFGYPRAHEDDVERAVRAGLAVVDAIGNLPSASGEPLAVRIGIATGLVVVGDLVGEGAAQEEAVIGDTPNLAARIQADAEPGQVWIAAATRRLLGDGFALEDRGFRPIKGFDQAQRVFEVTGEIAVESRFEARHADLPQMIGREQELALLNERWSLAKSGEGQCIVLTGEAGIGKSRLIQAMLDAAAHDEHVRIGFQCSSYHKDSPLWPVTQYLKRGAGILPADPEQVRLGKLEQFLAERSGKASRETIALIAGLLGSEGNSRNRSPDLLPQVQRSMTLEGLTRQLIGLAGSRPVLMFVEDVHWIDPTTLELIERCIDEIVQAPVLIVLSSRPEGEPELGSAGSITRLSLSQLSRATLKRLVRAVGGDQLSQATIDAIIDRTDGLPLFAEELTKSVLETGEAGIPVSLYDSLMSRLDRIPEAKAIVQAASCIGREFDRALLSAMLEIPETTLTDTLDRLVAAGVLLRFGGRQSGSFIFKHALVCNVAYESMLRNERKVRHGRIAHHMQTTEAVGEREEPEVVAFHQEQAGLFADAARNWFAACRRSVEQSADREAIAHAESALRCLQTMAPSSDRDELELEILVNYGAALLSTKGWASDEIADVYTRARKLADKLEKVVDQFASAWNLWLFNMQRGNVDDAQELVDRVLTFSRQIDADEPKLQAHHAAWTTLFNFAPLGTVREHLESGLALYDDRLHRHSWSRYGGHDARVCGCGHASWLAWLEGAGDSALDHARSSLATAEKIGHAYSKLVARFFLSSIHYYRREPEMVIECSSSAMELADSLGFAQHNAMSRIFRGWGISQSGSPADGLEEIRLGLGQLDSLNVGFRRTFYLTILAEASLEDRRFDAALESVDRALLLSKTNREIRWLPELLRIKAQASRHNGSMEQTESDALLRESIHLAREQGMRGFQLRAATELARNLAEAGERHAARDILEPLYSSFTEGLETADLVGAGNLLNELR